jgi:hypothetical protein
MAKKQAKKTGKRGGPRENSGRPPLANPRTEVLAIRLTREEALALRGKGAAWCRDTLLAALRG